MKIAFDMEELKKSLMASALTARNQLAEMAKQAQVQERLDQAVQIIKSSELMKNPKVNALAKRLAEVSVQWEKVLSEVRSKVSANVSAKKKAPAPKKKAAAKKETEKAAH